MKGQLSNAVKKERARKLISVGDRLAEDYFLSQVGQIKHLLVEEKLFEDNGISCYRGYTENYLDLKVSSTLDLVGKVVKGKVKKDHSLEIISIE
jgi:tRNA A37 methylthiotransferase MiaB